MKSIKTILAIAGRPGLYNLTAQTRTGILVESLDDQKRITVSAQQQVHALDEIAMYTIEGEVPLRELYESTGKALKGAKTVSHKAEPSEILAAFQSHVPNYDETQVYISDMKKFVSWYNLLVDYGFFAEEAKPAKVTKPKKTAERSADGESE
ncbi:MAG: DUF5606 domain-containing protein [Schleiferiaceae bacterium]|nr:DUF5606 domain-containing protein [Schleiferiaceae bacterium]